MVNFGLLAAEICCRVWGTHANYNGFRVLAALLHGTSSSVEQMVPPIFGRAAITLALAHISSSVYYFASFYVRQKVAYSFVQPRTIYPGYGTGSVVHVVFHFNHVHVYG